MFLVVIWLLPGLFTAFNTAFGSCLALLFDQHCAHHVLLLCTDVVLNFCYKVVKCTAHVAAAYRNWFLSLLCDQSEKEGGYVAETQLATCRSGIVLYVFSYYNVLQETLGNQLRGALKIGSHACWVLAPSVCSLLR